MLTMARTKTISSIDNEINKLTTALDKMEKKKTMMTEQLLKLQRQKQEFEAKQVMEAFRSSGKSLNELLIFLNVWVEMALKGRLV